MPAILLERLPLPSLHTYISFSVLFLALATFYAHQTVTAKLSFDPNTQLEEELGLPPELTNLTLPYGEDEHFYNMLYIMRIETWCIWTLVNSCYCVLILLGKLIQNIVFGELRVSEQQHLKDKFWNFVFYKFIFIFGVMNVQSMDEVVLWIAWFSGLGFLHLLTQLSKDRFEYLSFSPATPRSAHIKLLSLLVTILILCTVILSGCVWVGMNVSLTIFAFLAAESVLLLLRCLYVMVRYVIQLYDMSLEGVWEGRAIFVYYTELVFELIDLAVNFGHHLHMLLYGNIFLSMASLVICMQLRFLFYEFQRRLKRHKNYLRVVKDMESKFPMATQENLEQNADDCAICWERMESARKLPCGHLFHNSCLRSWLEQDTSCPTCRTTLSETNEREDPRPRQPGAPNGGEVIAPQPNQGTTNHFFHFDGSRYVSWLPSFSVEVTHTNLLPGQQAHATQTSQLDNMAREVQVVFPNIPQSVIMEDLRITRSIDLTIDNILEGRVTVPPVSLTSGGHQRNDSSGGTSNSSSSSEGATSQPLSLPPPTLPPAPSSAIPSSQLFSAAPLESQSQPQLPSSHQDLQFGELPSKSVTQQAAARSSEFSQSAGLPLTMTGGRFSKSATERMSMLDQRKKAMIEQARRNFELKQERQLSTESASAVVNPRISSEDNGASLGRLETQTEEIPSNIAQESSVRGRDAADSEDRVRRRALLLEATQRRLEGASGRNSSGLSS
ncbi:E3 ubiquitin-protein ligase amfr-like protein [Plakobranchus ocellatus]|uniref:E3 ubiquitin-protein ligase amfr-like protein n=1 Tax=Plakobranchus ocellatus TaxID=259542 RepID=A0AAV3YW70_9GAST|nr:E3 ubiquitin-protein ligase amfr-like protein [Plakobranchus ocellatus]